MFGDRPRLNYAFYVDDIFNNMSITDAIVKINDMYNDAKLNKLREKIRLLHKKIGSKNFFLKLIKIDPLVKDQMNASDTQRSIRAYEIKLFTKKSKEKERRI